MKKFNKTALASALLLSSMAGFAAINVTVNNPDKGDVHVYALTQSQAQALQQHEGNSLELAQAIAQSGGELIVATPGETEYTVSNENYHHFTAISRKALKSIGFDYTDKDGNQFSSTGDNKGSKSRLSNMPSTLALISWSKGDGALAFTVNENGSLENSTSQQG